MNKKQLQAIAQAAARNIKTEADLNEFRQMLTKITVETALNTELDDHLGSDRHEPSGTGNSRNGYTSKTLQTEDGQFERAFPALNAGAQADLPRQMDAVALTQTIRAVYHGETLLNSQVAARIIRDLRTSFLNKTLKPSEP